MSERQQPPSPRCDVMSETQVEDKASGGHILILHPESKVTAMLHLPLYSLRPIEFVARNRDCEGGTVFQRQTQWDGGSTLFPNRPLK